MPLLRRTAITAALAAVLSVVPLHGLQAEPLTAKDLPRLTRELAVATERAQVLTAQLDAAAQRDGGLRVAYARLDDTREAAQLALDQRARQVYMARPRNPLEALTRDLHSPALRDLTQRVDTAALTVDQQLVDDVTAQARQLAGLERQAEAFRLTLVAQAQEVLAEQDRARTLYAEAKTLADAAQAAEVQAFLETQRQTLDTVSERITLSLTPAQSKRSARAFQREAPIIALLERSGANIPAGYTRTGVTFSGEASWYGPGFVGNPTASGAPYDPERLTCAHKELPLGTVLHVSANGFAINCLVNDRGPYIGARILDMSRAGSRALGYSGLAQVVVEVLGPL